MGEAALAGVEPSSCPSERLLTEVGNKSPPPPWLQRPQWSMNVAHYPWLCLVKCQISRQKSAVFSVCGEKCPCGCKGLFGMKVEVWGWEIVRGKGKDHEQAGWANDAQRSKNTPLSGNQKLPPSAHFLLLSSREGNPQIFSGVWNWKRVTGCPKLRSQSTWVPGLKNHCVNELRDLEHLASPLPTSEPWSQIQRFGFR